MLLPPVFNFSPGVINYLKGGLNMTVQTENLNDDKMRAEIAKLVAETAKINRELRWYPWASLALAAVAVAGSLIVAFIK